MKKFYAIILLSCLLVACSKAKQDPNDDPAFAPVVNPHPQYFMMIKGFIDPKLPKSLKLKIISHFITNDPSCKYTVNALEGVYSERFRDITVTARPDSKGYYTLAISLDYFLQGKCKWIIQTISFLPTNTGFSPILISYFTEPADLPKKFQSFQQTKLRCDSNFNCVNDGYGYYGVDLPINHNYNYKLIINYSERVLK